MGKIFLNIDLENCGSCSSDISKKLFVIHGCLKGNGTRLIACLSLFFAQSRLATFHRKDKNRRSFLTTRVPENLLTAIFFEQTTKFKDFHQVFSKNLQKVSHFVKIMKTDRFGQKLATFSNKLPCFRVFIKFSAKGFKKCLIL